MVRFVWGVHTTSFIAIISSHPIHSHVLPMLIAMHASLMTVLITCHVSLKILLVTFLPDKNLSSFFFLKLWALLHYLF